MHKLLFLFMFFTIGSFSAEGKTKDFQAPERIKVSATVNLRRTSFYRGSSNISGYLNPGTELDVISVDASLKNGIGFQVEVVSGPRKGATGWVYYHHDPNRRVLELVDASGETFSPEANKTSPKTYSQVLARSLKSDYIGYLHPKTLWEKVASDQEHYTIDLLHYDGGRYVPILYKSESLGIPVEYTFYADSYDATFYRLPKMTQDVLKMRRVACLEKDIEAAEPEAGSEYQWIEGCQVLAKELTKASKEQLKLCLVNIKRSIIANTKDENGLVSRTKVFENLYRKLNPVEQRYAAMVYTAAGEAGVLTPPNEELEGIMKILDNRKAYATKRGYSQANVLDVALQPWQFSFYNREKKPEREAWRRVILKANPDEHPQIDDAIDAYISYQAGSSFDPAEEAEQIYHYHTNYVSPSWSIGKSKNEVKFKINGKELDGRVVRRGGSVQKHRFFKNIAWSFRNNAFRKAAMQESQP